MKWRWNETFHSTKNSFHKSNTKFFWKESKLSLDLKKFFFFNVTSEPELKLERSSFTFNYVKRQTRICTTWPCLSLACHLMFIISTHKLVVSRNLIFIKIFWAVFICSFSILRNSQFESDACRVSLNSIRRRRRLIPGSRSDPHFHRMKIAKYEVWLAAEASIQNLNNNLPCFLLHLWGPPKRVHPGEQAGWQTARIK